MSNTEIPMWRKVTIAICSLIIIVCLVLLGKIESIVHYDYNYVGKWDYHNISHIGNISKYDSRGYKLDDYWVNIGNHHWYSQKLEDKNGNDDFGELIKLYSYAIVDSENRYNGEEASIWIYDIITLEAGAGAQISQEGEVTYFDNYIILGNERVYNINFTNRKWNMRGFESYAHFHKRCISIIKDIDLVSYYKWEKDYNRYQNLSVKEKEERLLWESILYMILLVSGLCVFSLASKRLGKKNSHARNLALYNITCMALGLLIYGAMAIANPNWDGTLAFVLFGFLPSVLISSLIERFLAKKSHQDYHSYYLIPKWLSINLHITNEFRKRLLMIFLIYPFFFILPVPVVDMFFLAFYILPVLLILGIIWIVLWTIEGKKMDAILKVQNDKAQLYCRHCGKLIDADSDYCRYCGKKI